MMNFRPHSQITWVSVMRVIFRVTSSWVTKEPFCRSPEMWPVLPAIMSFGFMTIWIELLFAIEAYLDPPAEFADKYILHAVERLSDKLVHEINAYQSDNPGYADELVDPVPFPVNSVDLDAEITVDFGF